MAWKPTLFTRLRLGVGVCLMVLACGAQAQDNPAPTRLAVPEGVSSAEYQRAIRLRGVQARVFYVDALNGPIPMDGAPEFEPPRPQEPSAVSTERDWTRIILAGAVVVALLILFFKFSGSSSAVFRRRDGGTKTRASAREAAVAELAHLPADQFLAQLRAMPDQRAALVRLIAQLLHSTALRHELRLGRSETAREFLRRLPRSWGRLGDLRRIIMAEELVIFGGRELDKATFEDCLTRAAPLLRAGAK